MRLSIQTSQQSAELNCNPKDSRQPEKNQYLKLNISQVSDVFRQNEKECD